MNYLLQAAENDDSGGIAILLAILVGGAIVIALYLLPTIIAYSRHHKQLMPLAIVNFFFGWTMLGWVACLAWSFQSYRSEAPVTPN